MPGRAPLLMPSLSMALLAGRESGIAVLDGVYNNVKDAEGFLAECVQGRDFGFDGKTLIHPGQVDVCNEVFAPSAGTGRGGTGDHPGLSPGRPVPERAW